jgi:deoxyadenosine/deoxycytidine kinase
MERIARRGRDFERALSPTYLAQLNELYEAWVASFHLCPILTIPADDLDFVRTPAHLDLIVARVEDRLRGREEVVFPDAGDAGSRPTPR